MSVKASTAVFDHSRSKGSARLVLLALADVASDDGEVFAYKRSHRILARKANVDERTVPRAIAQLVELGEVEIVAAGDGRRSADYRITLVPAPDATPGMAGRHPTGGTAPTQGGRDATPIIPSVDPSSSPSSDALFDAGEPAPPTTEDFDRFWSTYPRRVGKGQARTAWARAVKRADVETILAGAGRYAAEVSGTELKYVAHPTTWLNGDRWEDDAGAVRGNRGGGPLGQVSQDRSPTRRIKL